MWNKPELLTRLANWLLLVTLLYALLVTARHFAEDRLPIRQVEVLGANHAETRLAAREALRGLQGSFFSVNLEQVRQGYEALPWVKSALVRKVWPDRLVVELTEHVPAAAWNAQAMLDVHGEVFPVRPHPGLPRIYAPDAMALEVAHRYGEFARALAAMDLKIDSVQVSARHAWRLRLDNGLVVELGRERLSERMRRFVSTYALVEAKAGRMAYVDLRYPNGFAIRQSATGADKA
ncbi:MAG: cell division protein FtsQ/DivIB [Hydrogenophilaceae bacterium]|nr:cell division protein FtsQ/DivIB [Hydrogenophilaceae bacterium]